MTRTSSHNSVIYYVLPDLWMTSRFHTELGIYYNARATLAHFCKTDTKGEVSKVKCAISNQECRQGAHLRFLGTK